MYHRSRRRRFKVSLSGMHSKKEPLRYIFFILHLRFLFCNFFSLRLSSFLLLYSALGSGPLPFYRDSDEILFLPYPSLNFLIVEWTVELFSRRCYNESLEDLRCIEQTLQIIKATEKRSYFCGSCPSSTPATLGIVPDGTSQVAVESGKPQIKGGNQTRSLVSFSHRSVTLEAV